MLTVPLKLILRGYWPFAPHPGAWANGFSVCLSFILLLLASSDSLNGSQRWNPCQNNLFYKITSSCFTRLLWTNPFGSWCLRVRRDCWWCWPAFVVFHQCRWFDDTAIQFQNVWDKGKSFSRFELTRQSRHSQQWPASRKIRLMIRLIIIIFLWLLIGGISMLSVHYVGFCVKKLSG